MSDRLAGFRRQDGAGTPAHQAVTLQTSSSADRSSASGVSASTPAIFHTQTDSQLSQESQPSQDPQQPAENDQEEIFPLNEPTLATVMLAIQDCKASLTNQIAFIRMDFSLLKQDIQNLRDRAGDMEEHISSLEDTVHPLSVNMRDNTGELVALRAKIDDLENRSWRNNLYFVGLPERAEGSHPEKFPTPGWGTFLAQMHPHSLMWLKGHTAPLRILPQREHLHALL